MINFNLLILFQISLRQKPRDPWNERQRRVNRYSKIGENRSPDFLTTRATSRYNFFTGQTEAEKPPAVWLIIRFLKS